MAVHTSWVVEAFDAYLTGKTVKAMLVTSAYADDATHEFRSSLVEAAGAGYTAGGVAATGVYVVQVGSSVGIICDDVVFGDVELSDVAGVAFYVSTGSSATDTVLVVDMLSDPVDTTGSPEFTYHPDPDGIVVLTVPA